MECNCVGIHATYFSISSRLSFPGFFYRIQISLRFLHFFKFLDFSKFSMFSRFVPTLQVLRRISKMVERLNLDDRPRVRPA